MFTKRIINGFLPAYGFSYNGNCWILVIVGLVLLVKYLWEGGQGRREQELALEILKKRYARGEIGKEEFEDKRKDLI